MGGGVLTSALEADLVDEVILHQVPGAGRCLFHKLAEHVHLRLLESIPAPGIRPTAVSFTPKFRVEF